MPGQKKVSSPFLIGIFLLVGIFVGVAAIIWLGANQFMKEQRLFVTYFNESVEGLEKGSAVKYQGVNCGTITEVNIAPDGRLIEIIMQVDEKIDVNDKMRAKPAMAGLAGGKFMQLHYPQTDYELNTHPNIDFNPEYELIQSSPSELEEITEATRQAINKTIDMMENLNNLQTAKISEETIKFLQTSTEFFENDELYETLLNLEESSRRLNTFLARLDSVRMIDNIEYASDNLLESTQRLEEFMVGLNEELGAMDLPEHIAKVYSRYDSTVVNTNEVITKMGYRTETVVFNLNDLLNELRETNKELQNTLRNISENPGQMFLSEPPEKED